MKIEEPMNAEQRKKLNAMCGDIERQVVLCYVDGQGFYTSRAEARRLKLKGIKLHKDDWRHIFVGTILKWVFLPAIEGQGFITLGQSSKKLTKATASDVIEMMFAFGSERGIAWSDPKLLAEVQGGTEGAH